MGTVMDFSPRVGFRFSTVSSAYGNPPEEDDRPGEEIESTEGSDIVATIFFSITVPFITPYIIPM